MRLGIWIGKQNRTWLLKRLADRFCRFGTVKRARVNLDQLLTRSVPRGAYTTHAVA